MEQLFEPHYLTWETIPEFSPNQTPSEFFSELLLYFGLKDELLIFNTHRSSKLGAANNVDKKKQLLPAGEDRKKGCTSQNSTESIEISAQSTAESVVSPNTVVEPSYKEDSGVPQSNNPPLTERTWSSDFAYLTNLQIVAKNAPQYLVWYKFLEGISPILLELSSNLRSSVSKNAFLTISACANGLIEYYASCKEGGKRFTRYGRSIESAFRGEDASVIFNNGLHPGGSDLTEGLDGGAELASGSESKVEEFSASSLKTEDFSSEGNATVSPKSAVGESDNKEDGAHKEASTNGAATASDHANLPETLESKKNSDLSNQEVSLSKGAQESSQQVILEKTSSEVQSSVESFTDAISTSSDDHPASSVAGETHTQEPAGNHLPCSLNGGSETQEKSTTTAHYTQSEVVSDLSRGLEDTASCSALLSSKLLSQCILKESSANAFICEAAREAAELLAASPVMGEEAVFPVFSSLIDHRNLKIPVCVAELLKKRLSACTSSEVKDTGAIVDLLDRMLSSKASKCKNIAKDAILRLKELLPSSEIFFLFEKKLAKELRRLHTLKEACFPELIEESSRVGTKISLKESILASRSAAVKAKEED